MFDAAMHFLDLNLHHVQAGQNFNSQGILEISKIALEELMQNALVHREYIMPAPIRLMIFDNRVEIASPGGLPDGLTIEDIKIGMTAQRNQLIAKLCSQTMYYRGLGTGIGRSMQEQHDIEFVNTDKQFTAILHRREDVEKEKSMEKGCKLDGEKVASSCGKVASSEQKGCKLDGEKVASSIGSETKNRPVSIFEKVCYVATDWMTVEEIAAQINREKSYIRNKIIPQLLAEGKIEMLFPNAPRHPRQKYRRYL